MVASHHRPLDRLRALSGAGGRGRTVGACESNQAVTSISWIPSEAIEGMTKMPFEAGVAHYDVAPPESVDGTDAIEELQAADRFRFANRLAAWIEVEDGKITGYGYGDGSRGHIGSTTMNVGRKMTFEAVPLPDLQGEPEVGDGWVRFTQTAGGRTGVPAPRRVSHPPFVQFRAPLAWATLSLTIHADGRTEHELVRRVSPFPRHWVYGPDGKLSHKSGLVDFKDWYRHAFGKHTPWGDEDSPALVTEVETALERELSTQLMRGGAKPRDHEADAGHGAVRAGPAGRRAVPASSTASCRSTVDGELLAELGPGAMLGERAVIEGGLRTSTLTLHHPL